MASPELLTADILITAEIGSEQAQATVEAFSAIEVAGNIRRVPVRRGAGELQWLVLAALPLHAFLSRLGAGLADDAAQALKDLVHRVLGNRPRSTSTTDVLVLQDSATRLQVALEADLPAQAYRQLVKLDLSAFHHGPLHYDRKLGKWRSELDEAQRPAARNRGRR